MALRNNPDIDNIVNDAVESAKELGHGLVTIEHVALALVQAPSFATMLDELGIEKEDLETDLFNYLTAQQNLKTGDSENPKKTHAIERVFNRAFTQVLFTNREQMEAVDLYVSIASESNSAAAYFFIKYGIDKNKVVSIHNRRNSRGGGKSNKGNQADAVLKEYTTDLTALAEEGEIDPVIGREHELGEIAQILARRTKSNVLMVGDPGVGKTAIAEGLARKIVDGDVPS